MNLSPALNNGVTRATLRTSGKLKFKTLIYQFC